jgi:formate hydrogenlyase subunit 3/multisubunit Na+/H+ antiporter MnhD subunit
MTALIILIPLLPFLAAALIGGGHFAGLLDGETSERGTARIALAAMTLSSLLALGFAASEMLGYPAVAFNAGMWFGSGAYRIDLNFTAGGFAVRLAALFAILLLVAMRFAVNYLHREAAYHRFFFVLSLFAAAMLLLVLAGNAVGTFFGWEVAGLCSYLLIAYAYDRPTAAHNATRVFIANRIGDAGFMLGIGLSFAWLGSVDWVDINKQALFLPDGKATALALCFSAAAFAKSAQVPFAPWLGRAMEGPTPSSAAFYGAVMVHAGVFLVLLLRPLFEHAPLAMEMLVLVGTATAVYGWLAGLTQADVKSSLIFAASAQLGLMFLECGLGLWNLAAWHLCAHAVVRGYQMFTAPSLMHIIRDNPAAPVAPAIARQRWAYVVSLQRLWLEQFADWTVVKPTQRLARDLQHFDDRIGRLIGAPAPAVRALSSLAQWEERKVGSLLDNDDDAFAAGSGLARLVTGWAAAVSQWFEERFVLRGVGEGMVSYGRYLGHAADYIEQLLLQPRYLALFVFITLLAVF